MSMKKVYDLEASEDCNEMPQNAESMWNLIRVCTVCEDKSILQEYIYFQTAISEPFNV